MVLGAGGLSLVCCRCSVLTTEGMLMAPSIGFSPQNRFKSLFQGIPILVRACSLPRYFEEWQNPFALPEIFPVNVKDSSLQQ